MKKKIFAMTLAASLSLASAALVSTPTVFAATTQGKVTYTKGATTVWTSAGKGQTVKRYLSKDTALNFVSSKQVYGTLWYETADHGWLPETYVSLGNTTTPKTKVNLKPATTTKAAVGNVTTKYHAGAVTVWRQPNISAVAGYLSNGKSVAYTETKSVGGATWYHLQQGGWILADFTGFSAAKTAQQTTKSTSSTQTSQATQSSQSTQSTQTTQTTTRSNSQTQSSQTTSTSATGVLGIAEQYLGVPYQWGGTTPAGFDCSGFVQYVFAKAGVSLPRTTTEQETVGTVIPVSQAQPGDLLFWGARGSSYHVAIYMGNGRYINAPAPGQSVSESSISTYFAPSFAEHL